MNNTENIGAKIYNLYVTKEQYDTKYNNLVGDFLDLAYHLVDISNNIYQVEKTIFLNQVSLKDYILNSDICNGLKENNVTDYSYDFLKNYIDNYMVNGIGDAESYKVAIDLYGMLNEIEGIEIDKIDEEMTVLFDFVSDINRINVIDKSEYSTLRESIIEQFKSNYSVVDESLNYINAILDDIFNYYLNGNKELPLR